MRISPARTYRRTGVWRGFTLIELLIVMLLLGVTTFMVMPAFQNLLEGRLAREANRMAGVIRMMRNEAILEGLTFRLMLDMSTATYWVEQRDAKGGFGRRQDVSLLKEHQFPSSVVMERLFMFGEEILPRKGHPVPIVVDSSGFVDPFLLHLLDGDVPHTFRVTGFTGKVSMVEGHVKE